MHVNAHAMQPQFFYDCLLFNFEVLEETMSGIFGFTGTFADAAEAERVSAALGHWTAPYGREKSDVQLFGDSGIGCHMEHFSDRFSCGGPILESGGKYAVIDALLYNREELLDMLPEQDQTISDELLLLRLVEQRGFDALASVNGDFAGAIFDPELIEWNLFRDHLGVRPLYIYQDEGMFAFSTDILSLAALPGADLRVNVKPAYLRVVRLNAFTPTETDLQRVRMPEPATVLTVRRTPEGFAQSSRTYWKLRSRKIRLKDESAYREELRRLVTDAVRRRLDAITGKVGVELSGGLDSSVIAITINRMGREALYYSWSRDPSEHPLNPGEDERKTVQDICCQENIQCKFFTAEDRNLTQSGKLLYPPFMDTTRMGAGAYWMYANGARVVFSGHGGDEGISHRGNPRELYYYGEYAAFVNYFWHQAKGSRIRPIRAVQNAWNTMRDFQRSNHQFATEEELNSRLLCEPFREHMQRTLQVPDFTFNYDPYTYVMQGGSRQRLDNAAYQGAVNGVRYIFPYLDHRLMDFALSIPRCLFVQKGENRVLFRETFKDLMPHSMYQTRRKSSASKKATVVSQSLVNELQHQLNFFLTHLDREMWSGILDFDYLESLKPDVSMELNELRRIRSMLRDIPLFYVTQKMIQKAGNLDA